MNWVLLLLLHSALAWNASPPPRRKSSLTENVYQYPQDLGKHTNSPTSSYFGWSTWSLQASKAKGYGFCWLNETNVRAQVEILANQFSQFGYNRVNLDSGWQDPELDEYGRTTLNAKTFPSGIHKFQSYLASKNFKLGLYYLPGIDSRAVKNQLPIKNTPYTADQIILCPVKKRKGQEEPNSKRCKRPLANAFGAGFALNYSHPGSQMYVNSVVDQLYSWDVSFVKLDGIVPGSSFQPSQNKTCNTHSDLAAWRKAIDERFEQEWQYVGREKIWLVASWAIPTSEGPILDQDLNSWRLEQDIEAYSTVMTTFDRVIRNVKTATLWTSIDQNRQWRGQRDLDSVLVSDMTYPESQSMVTLWAMLGSPIYSGDDLTKLPQARKALLTNPEVLELARIAATNPARLDGFNVADATHRGSDDSSCAARIEEQIWELQEKRRIVLGLSLFEDLSLSPSMDYDDLLSSTCVNSLVWASNLNLHSLDLPPKTEPVQKKDLWALQFWVLEVDLNQIFVAVVNAGKQTLSDKSVEVELNLSQLEEIQKTMNTKKQKQKGKQYEERNYSVRDLWKRQDIGFVGLYSTFKFTLNPHQSKLLKFTST